MATTVPPMMLGVLDGEVAQAADAEHSDPLGRLDRATFMALYVVTPAQLNGAASTEVMPSGTGTT